MGDENVSALYERAVDLYVHEDQLNWTKLNNLFYVTGGLLAVLGFTLDVSDGLVPLDESEAAVLRIVSVFGMLVSIVFAVALHFGVKYLLARKAAVIRLEHRLAGIAECRVVMPQDPDDSGMQVSPTGHLLRYTPIAVTCIWVGLLVASFAA